MHRLVSVSVSNAGRLLRRYPCSCLCAMSIHRPSPVTIAYTKVRHGSVEGCTEMTQKVATGLSWVSKTAHEGMRPASTQVALRTPSMLIILVRRRTAHAQYPANRLLILRLHDAQEYPCRKVYRVRWNTAVQRHHPSRPPWTRAAWLGYRPHCRAPTFHSTNAICNCLVISFSRRCASSTVLASKLR